MKRDKELAMKQSQAPQAQSQGNADDREAGRDERVPHRSGEESSAGNSNAPDDDESQGEGEDENEEGMDYVAGGDKSNRAARSGATGERQPGGRANKREPKDQDEKGNAGPRNNTDRS